MELDKKKEDPKLTFDLMARAKEELGIPVVNILLVSAVDVSNDWCACSFKEISVSIRVLSTYHTWLDPTSTYHVLR
jgi:hypothetical protein